MKNNYWGAVYVASPVTIAFQGGLEVSGNTKGIGNALGSGVLHPDPERPQEDTAEALPANAATPSLVVPQDGAANGPVYGAGLFASNGAHLSFFGVTTFSRNIGLCGCGITLDNATTSFAPNRAVNFVGNSAPDTDGCGPALRATCGSSVEFGGSVLMIDNWVLSGAGGAVFLDTSAVTFEGSATLRNNSIKFGPGWVSGLHVVRSYHR
jgi:hypothetical protein